MGKKSIDYLNKDQNIHLKLGASSIEGVLAGMKTHLALSLIVYLRDSTSLTRAQILRKLKLKASQYDDLMSGALHDFTYEKIVEMMLKLGFGVRGASENRIRRNHPHTGSVGFKSVSFEFITPNQ